MIEGPYSEVPSISETSSLARGPLSAEKTVDYIVAESKRVY